MRLFGWRKKRKARRGDSAVRPRLKSVGFGITGGVDLGPGAPEPEDGPAPDPFAREPDHSILEADLGRLLHEAEKKGAWKKGA
jgi:hypothetical protein